jgi:hypothetical protein
VDVEKTIEFILSQQARTEAALGRLAETQQETQSHLRQTDQLLKRAIRAAVQEARAERRRRQELADRFSVAHEQLAAAQRKTEASLAAFIESMRLGGNGHPKS